MLEVMRACAAHGLAFPARAVAVTTEGSALHERAGREGWLARFPMWDWVGGRTSVTSPVGLLPLALLGHDVRAFLAGAAAMDEATRARDPEQNPAALLALFWFVQGGGRGERAMVVLPYKDRLLLLSRYLQQLVMESLGKRLDRRGRAVEQGLTVYGNKGSTDQHAYVQQLRDGRHDFFAVFVRVLADRDGASAAMEGGADGPTAGDYLDGFLLGTRTALAANGRRSATITLARIDARSLGALIALFERTVGLYGELIDVNAYHQPGVEAGKKAAQQVLELQGRILGALGPQARSATEVAARLGADPGLVWAVLQHLAANRSDVRRLSGSEPATAGFVRTPDAPRGASATFDAGASPP
jgi:glucose-6-phosphate isomerase